MPQTEVRVFRASPQTIPLMDWLGILLEREPKAHTKCLARIEMLRRLGNDLRRPLADYLRDGIYELRIRHGRVNFRILYFFCGRNIVCLSHAITKDAAVPTSEIEYAISCMALVNSNPIHYTNEFSGVE